MASANLDFNDLYRKPASIKLLVFLFIAALILALAYFFFFSKQLEERKSLAEEEQKLRTTFSQKARDAANLAILEEELERLNSSFQILLKQLPTEAEVPNLIQELYQAASTNSLRLNEVTPKPPVADGEYVEILPYSINTQGDNNQLSKFAKDVGGLSRIVVLSGLNITATKDGKNLDLKASANTYKATATATAEPASAAAK